MRRTLIALTMLAAAGALAAGCGRQQLGLRRRLAGDHGRPVGR